MITQVLMSQKRKKPVQRRAKWPSTGEYTHAVYAPDKWSHVTRKYFFFCTNKYSLVRTALQKKKIFIKVFNTPDASKV